MTDTEDVNINEDVENRGNPDPKGSEESAAANDAVLDEDVVQVNPIDETTLSALSKYAKLYPKNKVFHFTSDGQIFLDSGKRDAEKHQKDLGTGELKSYSVQ